MFISDIYYIENDPGIVQTPGGITFAFLNSQYCKTKFSM